MIAVRPEGAAPPGEAPAKPRPEQDPAAPPPPRRWQAGRLSAASRAREADEAREESPPPPERRKEGGEAVIPTRQSTRARGAGWARLGSARSRSWADPGFEPGPSLR